MKLTLSSVRGKKTAWADDAAQDYGSRIGRYFSWEEVVFKPEGAHAEAERLLRGLGPRVMLVAVDERGEQRSSEGWAQLLETAAREGATGLWFALGGAYGHAPLVRERAAVVLALGPMVLNHAVARVVVVEQLYRALTIRAGEPYHHGG